MHIFDKIIKLSQKIAASLLKNESSTDLENSKVFSKSDKGYILKNLTDEFAIKERFNLANQIDKDADWKTVKSQTGVPVRKLYWNYAAAVAIVVGMLASGYFFKDNLFDDSLENKSIIVTTIQKGTDKATLTLDDGSEVALEKGKSFQTKNANSNGEQIVYGKTDNRTSKIKIAYNYLTIPRGGEFFIKLSDGTKIWLNSESQLKYPVAFADGEARRVELIYGEAYFDVSAANHKGHEFKVVTQMQEIKVLGTEFNVKAYEDEDNIYTTLVEGKVAVSFEDYKQNLTPSQQSNLNLKNNSLSVANVDVYNETSWKDGVFSFEGKSLKDIMKVLSRWYDMDVVFKNKEIEREEFNGILGKDQDIEEILSSIENFGIIKNYEIKDKKVVLE